MAFTNALQATQSGVKNNSGNNIRTQTGNPFQGKCQKPQLAAGKDGNIDPDKSCKYCKDTGHNVYNCLCLQMQKAFLAQQQQLREGSN